MYIFVLFEYFFNEKMCIWLCIEFLIQQMVFYLQIVSYVDVFYFFCNVGDLLDVLECGEVCIDLVKELECQQCKFQLWVEVLGVDQECINELCYQLKQFFSILMVVLCIGQFLCEDCLIVLVCQCLSISGGCCSFDLLILYIWFYMLQVYCDEQVVSWFVSFDLLVQFLSLIFDFICNFVLFCKQISFNGFYQDNGEDVDLLCLCFDLVYQFYL